MTYDSAYNHGELYDAVNDGFTQDIGFYLNILGPHPKRVLELACGTGRVTLPLIRAGHRVTGVDIAGPMLATFGKKLRSEGLAAEALVEADLAKFEPRGTYDFILIPYKALQHVHDLGALRRTFATALAHLNPGGRFVIDVFNPSLKLLTRPNDKRAYSAKYVADGGKAIQIFESSVYDAATQVNVIDWHHVDSDGKTFCSSRLSMRMFFPQELRAMLTYAGFEIERDLGDYDGTSFTSESLHQVLVSRKR